MSRGNVLFITLDQCTAGALSGPLAACVPTPNIDRLAAAGTVFENHFTVTVPCGPARASLLTGLYAMNHRAVRNGAPLARHHATLGTEARKAGYEPLLFGYSDIAADPTGLDPQDPVLAGYEGVAPGFREIVEMRFDEGVSWQGYLRDQGYGAHLGVSAGMPDHQRPVAADGSPGKITDPAIYDAAHSDTAYLTDRTLTSLSVWQGGPWIAHVTYIRPHPPLVAPAPWNALVDPATLPAPDRRRPDHPFLDAWFSAPSVRNLFWGFDGDCAGLSDAQIAPLRAVYLGLIAELDHHIGRFLDWLDATGQAQDTLVILTSDHGEMLGDKSMWGKECIFDPAYHVPLIVRVPGATPARVQALTESVDVTPTILDWIGQSAPPAMDGRSLLPLVEKNAAAEWRDAVLMEADFAHPQRPTRFQKHLGLGAHQGGVSILRETNWKYVHFGGGIPPMLFDLAADPGEIRNLAPDPAHAPQLMRLSAKLIDRMTERRDRRLTHHCIGA